MLHMIVKLHEVKLVQLGEKGLSTLLQYCHLRSKPGLAVIWDLKMEGQVT